MLKRIEEMIEYYKETEKISTDNFIITGEDFDKTIIIFSKKFLSDLEELKKLREDELVKELSKNKLRNDVEGV